MRICPLKGPHIGVLLWPLSPHVVHDGRKRPRTGTMVGCVLLPVLSVHPGEMLFKKKIIVSKYLKTYNYN